MLSCVVSHIFLSNAFSTKTILQLLFEQKNLSTKEKLRCICCWCCCCCFARFNCVGNVNISPSKTDGFWKWWNIALPSALQCNNQLHLRRFSSVWFVWTLFGLESNIKKLWKLAKLRNDEFKHVMKSFEWIQCQRKL